MTVSVLSPVSTSYLVLASNKSLSICTSQGFEPLFAGRYSLGTFATGYPTFTALEYLPTHISFACYIASRKRKQDKTICQVLAFIFKKCIRTLNVKSHEHSPSSGNWLVSGGVGGILSVRRESPTEDNNTHCNMKNI